MFIEGYEHLSLNTNERRSRKLHVLEMGDLVRLGRAAGGAY